MVNLYVAGKRLAHGLLILQRGTERKMWVRVRLRKNCKCAATGVQLRTGDAAYRPCVNTEYRGERVAAAHAEGLAREPA